MIYDQFSLRSNRAPWTGRNLLFFRKYFFPGIGFCARMAAWVMKAGWAEEWGRGARERRDDGAKNLQNPLWAEKAFFSA